MSQLDRTQAAAAASGHQQASIHNKGSPISLFFFFLYIFSFFEQVQIFILVIVSFANFTAYHMNIVKLLLAFRLCL